MRVLIIGCGYVGLPLGADLKSKGHEVWGLRRSAANDAEMAACGMVPLHGDITELATLEQLPTGFDWVVNCVATSGGGVEDYRRVYLEGTRNLVSWLKSARVGKFVYTSSTGVYGQNDGSLVDESSPTDPASETGRILVQTEKVLLQAAGSQGFPSVILRLAGIYGPGRGYWLRQFLSGEARLEGDGSRILNMVHRDDVIGAVEAGLDRGATGSIYNVVDNEPVSQFDLFGWLAQKTGRGMPASAPAPAGLQSRRGATNKRISNRKLTAELNYRFRYPTFREGFSAEL